LRSLQEIQPDFEEEAKAYAGLWSQRKKKKKKKKTVPGHNEELHNFYTSDESGETCSTHVGTRYVQNFGLRA
jgi:hypothetical protein